MNSSRFFLFLLFIFFATEIFAQDVIVQKDGTKIYCRIVDEDSTSIYYIRKPQKTRFEIKKTEVERYDLPARLHKKEEDPGSAKDSINYMHILLCINGGIASPLGDFGNKRIDYEPAGFARLGGLFQISAMLKITSYFGISLGYRYQVNPFAARAYAEQAHFQSPNSRFKVQASGWKEKGIYAGVCFMLPYKKTGYWFDLSLSVTAIECSYPEMDITTTTGSSTSFYSVYADNTKCLGIIGGLGFHYKIGKNMFFNVGLNTFSAKPTFTEIHTSGSSLKGNYTQKINTIGIETGFSFQLL